MLSKIHKYNPSDFHYQDSIYSKYKLEYHVDYISGDYIIRNDELDITVWGNTLQEAKEAFSFKFDSLHHNFALEKDENLTENAKQFKNQLKLLVNS